MALHLVSYGMARSNGGVGVKGSREIYRDQRGLPFVETLAQDLRYGIRMLRKSPGFTLVASVSLALGIGANTAVFTFIDALLLRSLPVPNPQELVEVAAQRRGDFAALSFPMYRDLRERQRVWTDVLASAGETPYRLTIPEASGRATELDNMRVAFVSGNYFAVLGVRPVLGRLIAEDDDRNSESSETLGSVIVISDLFWQRQFGRDPGVLGRTIGVGRSRCTIIGVVAAPFVGESVGAAAIGWVPLVPFTDRNDLNNRRGVFASYVARLKPGVGRDRAQAAMTLLFQQLLTVEGVVRGPVGDYILTLTPAGTGTDLGLRRQFARPLRIVMIIVALVLVIACANVANLLLERATSRRGEIRVRLAIGCSRARLLRQLITESVLLSMLGALAGVVVAYAGIQGLLRMVDVGPVPVRLDVTPHLSVLAFLVGISLLAGIGFGLVPALQSIRVDVAGAIQSVRRGIGTRTRRRLSRGLVMTQIAVSLVLVVTAGLLISSLANLHQVDYGFRPGQVVMFDLAGAPASSDPAVLADQARRVYQTIGQVPGVRSASVSSLLLFSPTDVIVPLTIHGYTPAPGRPIGARWNSVSAGYLETIGMTLVDGRTLAAQDRLGTPLVAVVNESMVRRYFSGGRAVGGVVEIDGGRAATRTPGASTGAFGRPIQIVGVVRDVMQLCSLFGGLALLLASVGLYGVLSYTVAQRTGEIGIRMALGATARRISWLVLRETLGVTLVGVAAGLVLTFASTRLVASLLFGLTATSPQTMASAMVVLAATAVVAAYVPARRASRVDPMVALRHE